MTTLSDLPPVIVWTFFLGVVFILGYTVVIAYMSQRSEPSGREWFPVTERKFQGIDDLIHAPQDEPTPESVARECRVYIADMEVSRDRSLADRKYEFDRWAAQVDLDTAKEIVKRREDTYEKLLAMGVSPTRADELMSGKVSNATTLQDD